MYQLTVEFRNFLSQSILGETDFSVLYYGGESSTKFKEILSTKKSQNISPL